MKTLKLLKDSYGILKPTNDIFTKFTGFVDICNRYHIYDYDRYASVLLKDHVQKLNARHAQVALNNALALARSCYDSITMTMFMFYADGKEHNYREIHARMFPDKPYGHDIDCWRSLEKRGLIKFSRKLARGAKTYCITKFGREVMSALEANDVVYKVIKWYKIDDENERIHAMIQADLRGDNPQEDTQPKAFASMLEALFNPKSDLHDLGSCYRWMNTVVKLMQSDSEFCRKLSSAEVTNWLGSHEDYYGVMLFKSLLAKAQKKHMKKAAA